MRTELLSGVSELAGFRSEDYNEVLELHKPANKLEFTFERLASDLADIEALTE